MSKELATTNNMEMLSALRNTIAPGLTDGEFLLFAEMCKATGLNPITKEIWPIKAGGRLQLMTGINGFMRIANSHPQFDGMEVENTFEGTQLVSCTVKVHRKDRKFPSVATAYLSEYSKPSPVWKQMPSVMLAKCAKSLAIREAFIQELGGLYTAEEMPSSFAAPMVQPIEGMETVVSTKTGEVLGFKAESVQIEGLETPKIPEKTRLTPTFYDIRTMEEPNKSKAAAYLRDCRAVNIMGDIWRSPMRLDRLTNYVTEDVQDANQSEEKLV